MGPAWIKSVSAAHVQWDYPIAIALEGEALYEIEQYIFTHRRKMLFYHVFTLAVAPTLSNHPYQQGASECNIGHTRTL